MLKSFGENKVAVIKVAKEVLGLGLMDAKKFVESAPVAIKEGIKPDVAAELGKKFTEAGAEIEIK
jgi:large subunit ribosomal protein L7/L12